MDMYISIIRITDMYISVIRIADICKWIEDICNWIEDIFNSIADMYISVIKRLNSKTACHTDSAESVNGIGWCPNFRRMIEDCTYTMYK